MRINYKTADRKIIELEVSDDVGTFYLESMKAEKNNNRKNSRIERHTSFEEIEGYLFKDAQGHITHVYSKLELPKHTFNHETQFEAELTEVDGITQLLSCLNERQQYLIRKCFLEGWSYTDLAALEGKDESAIRHAANRAKKKLRSFLK